MSLQRRLEKLEARSLSATVGRLFFLIPDLWPDEDRVVFETLGGESLADLVARRTGVRPVFGTGGIWAIVYHMPEEAHTWDEATKAAYLEAHETRPLAPGQRRDTP